MIDAVDCATPHAGLYPPWAEVVLGYAGGHTLHQWTPEEVNECRAEGFKWLPIWTARNRSDAPPLNATAGHADALGMIARLPVYNHMKTDWVFYDVEPGIFDRDPTGARAAIAAWKADMHAAGYPNAFVYTVERQGGDWIAPPPDNVRPKSIPSGKVGVQYGGNGTFDYDVFVDSILGDDPMTSPTAWSTDDDTHVLGLLRKFFHVSNVFSLIAGQVENDDAFAILVALAQGNVNNVNIIKGLLNSIQNGTGTLLNNEKAIIAAIAALPTSAATFTDAQIQELATGIESDLHVTVDEASLSTALRHDIGAALTTS